MTTVQQQIGVKSMLRFLTVGSVDDGKSTLIGRLLYDSQGLYEDQLSKLIRDSQNRDCDIDFSLITDGLIAEREQGITIDVAYRYFSTPTRKFIIADTPGHDYYTRNMVSAASVSDVAVLLIDARKRILPQTCRHAYIASLLGIRRIIVAVNKMDLVDFDSQIFGNIQDDFLKFAAKLGLAAVDFVPISARDGDNVVLSSPRMPWYEGSPLLTILESVPAESGSVDAEFRLPVQLVIRPNQDFRGYAGQIASGTLRKNQAVAALPSNQQTRIAEILLDSKQIDEAFAPMSVLVTLSDHIELGRGDMLVDPERLPIISSQFHAMLIWMSSRKLHLNTPYLIKHTSQTVCGSVVRLHHKIDTQTLGKTSSDCLDLNDIGEVEIETHKPIFGDRYVSNQQTGSFVVIDPIENDTLAAGVILGAAEWKPDELNPGFAYPPMRSKSLTVWFTGLSGSGKTTISHAVYTELLALGVRVEMLDGDVIRKHLNSDLGFSRKDRDENVRRIGFLAHLLARNGVVVLVSAISPYRLIREEVRVTLGGNFVEVYVNAPLHVCQQRDPKGLYKEAREKRLTRLTGIDDPYEPPLVPEIECNTDQESVKTSTNKVLSAIKDLLRYTKEQDCADPVVSSVAVCE